MAIDRDTLHQLAHRAMGTRKALLERETGYLFHHGRRTAALAMHLCGRVDPGGEVDRELLYAAALFHDVGKGIAPHAETGAAVARQLLAEVCSTDACASIAELIQLHNKRGRPDLPAAARILQDADVLDHIGTQSVWLCFAYNAYTETGPYASLDYYTGEENRRQQQRWREMLNFDASREIYDRRLAVELAFMLRFGGEMAGEP